MEKRTAKRVESFPVEGTRGIEPVWIIQETTPDAILGLLVDIGANGIQILTPSGLDLKENGYRLMVHTDKRDHLMTTIVSPKWSRAQGTMYHRNGFEFGKDVDPRADVDKVLAARQAGYRWLRCELVPLQSA